MSEPRTGREERLPPGSPFRLALLALGALLAGLLILAGAYAWMSHAEPAIQAPGPAPVAPAPAKASPAGLQS